MTEADCKIEILRRVTANAMSLEELALLCGAARKVEIIEVEDTFRDAVWSLIDSGEVIWNWDRGLQKV